MDARRSASLTHANAHDIALAPAALTHAVRGLLAVESRGALLVARSPNPVEIAALAYTWTLEHGGMVAWLDELYAFPPERNRGIGRALLLHAIAHAKDAGAIAMELEVAKSHARAADLYARRLRRVATRALREVIRLIESRAQSPNA